MRWLRQLLCFHRFAFERRLPPIGGRTLVLHVCLRCGAGKIKTP